VRALTVNKMGEA